jgi:hypothetical protein
VPKRQVPREASLIAAKAKMLTDVKQRAKGIVGFRHRELDGPWVRAQFESGAMSGMTAAKRCSGSPACACAYSWASSSVSNGPTIESGGPWNGPVTTT